MARFQMEMIKQKAFSVDEVSTETMTEPTCFVDYRIKRFSYAITIRNLWSNHPRSQQYCINKSQNVNTFAFVKAASIINT